MNAYNTSLGQIRQFVADKKYYDDIPILQALVEEEALEKMGNDQFGVSVAFSATNISDNDLIDNIAIVSKDVVLKTLNDTQTEKGFYTYKMVNPAKYKIDGLEKIVYLSPREIANKEKTYERRYNVLEKKDTLFKR